MSSAFADEEEEGEGGTQDNRGSGAEDGSFDLSLLRQRMDRVQETDKIGKRLEALEEAFVLVFDEDTDDEAVYSMEVEGDPDSHVVVAFEDRSEAERYAVSLQEEAFDSVASVQALDVEALVVTSRDADFRVGMVFKGALQETPPPGESSALFITSSEPKTRVSISITMVPDSLYEGKTSEDFLDLAEDPIWVLVHDHGTSDAQFFKMNLNGTSSVVCFKDEESAKKCGEALENKGAQQASTMCLLLEELIETLHEEIEVCLVDEVVETLMDDEDPAYEGTPGVVASDTSDQVLGTVGGADGSPTQESSAMPADVRAMLDRCFDSANDSGDDSG
jgi:hypothetical protein